MIRAATPRDLPRIAALWNDMIRATTATFTTKEKTRAGLQAMLCDRPHSFFVADGDPIAGFVTWGPFRAGPGYAHTVEHTIIVGKKGHGIGRALMEHACHAAAAQGHHVMIAGISGENAAARDFHAAQGFAEVGRLPQVGHKAGRWIDLIFMHKLLNAP